jgi:hypothetical protein
MVKNKRLRCAHGVAALLVMASAGCGQDPHGAGDRRNAVTAADCVILLRLGGETFREVAYGGARDRGAELGDAQQSSCDDIGRDARGAYFADDAPLLTTWAVRGQDPAEVVATVGVDGGLAFYVADALSDSHQDRLTTELSTAE